MEEDDLMKILEESFYLFKERLSDEDFKKVNSINFDKIKLSGNLLLGIHVWVVNLQVLY